jgi:hypothetical protein
LLHAAASPKNCLHGENAALARKAGISVAASDPDAAIIAIELSPHVASFNFNMIVTDGFNDGCSFIAIANDFDFTANIRVIYND